MNENLLCLLLWLGLGVTWMRHGLVTASRDQTPESKVGKDWEQDVPWALELEDDL